MTSAKVVKRTSNSSNGSVFFDSRLEAYLAKFSKRVASRSHAIFFRMSYFTDIHACRIPLQAVMGSLVKRYWARENNCEPGSIYHCTVMPCFDKKLEAARSDFDVPGITLYPEPHPTPPHPIPPNRNSSSPALACAGLETEV